MARKRRLTRAPDGMIGGVCAGWADYLGTDRDLFRLAYVILSAFSAAFPGILVYIVLWLAMPKGGFDLEDFQRQ